MDQPLRPVIVFDRDGDVDVFVSVAAARGSIEAIDVEDGEYVAIFTHDGHLVDVTTANDRVHLRISEQRDEGRLAELIAERRPGTTDVRELVNRELRRAWEHRWPRWPRWLDRAVHGTAPPPQI